AVDAKEKVWDTVISLMRARHGQEEPLACDGEASPIPNGSTATTEGSSAVTVVAAPSQERMVKFAPGTKMGSPERGCGDEGRIGKLEERDSGYEGGGEVEQGFFGVRCDEGEEARSEEEEVEEEDEEDEEDEDEDEEEGGVGVWFNNGSLMEGRGGGGGREFLAMVRSSCV
ncbi:hypothetical protein HDU67_009819, partial [Dinochytrium kinnereticum]